MDDTPAATDFGSDEAPGGAAPWLVAGAAGVFWVAVGLALHRWLG
jgi:hypothetical protein